MVPDSQTVILFAGPNGIVEVERDTGVELASTELVTSGIGYVPAGSGDVSEPRVVAVDKAGSGLFVLDGATLQPVTGVSGTEGEIKLESKPVGPLLVQGSGKNLQIWVPVGPAACRQ